MSTTTTMQKLSEEQSRASLEKRMRARQQTKIAELRQALIENGYQRVCEQAKALGLSRSSAWAVLQANHKNRGLSPHVIGCIGASPQLPANARQVIEDYVRERLAGAYGHPTRSLREFRTKLDAVGFFNNSAVESSIALPATAPELCGTEDEEFVVARSRAAYRGA